MVPEFFETRVDTSKSLQIAEQPFNIIAPFVKFAVVLQRTSCG